MPLPLGGGAASRIARASHATRASLSPLLASPSSPSSSRLLQEISHDATPAHTRCGSTHTRRATHSHAQSHAELNEKHVQRFRDIVGTSNLISDSESLAPMNQDWMKHYQGQSKLAITPETTEQTQDIIHYCNQENIAVVPQGGNTGLVGGATPIRDEIIISLKKMNKVLDFDPVIGVVVCEAGCILQDLDTFLRDQGFVMPLDLGAKGSCHIGGNVATNAGGIRYVRYGSLRGNVLGMEAVLGNGTVLDNLSSLRKDNTGYDLKQLMIGSEGTLGIITKLAILTPRLASSVNVMMIGLESFEEVIWCLKLARSELQDIISAVEFMDQSTMEVATTHLDIKQPLQDKFPFYVLIETSGSFMEHDQDKLDNFLQNLTENKSQIDGVVAQDSVQASKLWRLREGAAEALSKVGYTYKYDVSVPTTQMYQMVESMRERLGSPRVFDPKHHVNVVGYGHLGDGNLHLNVVTKDYDEHVFRKIEPFIFEQVADLKGSVSAEHGIGRAKVEFLHMSKSSNMIALMHTIKDVLDPNGIMNPNKLLT